MADLRRDSDSIKITDCGTAETVCIPITDHNKGELKRITTCLGAAISSADSKVVVSHNATVLGTITIANTSSAAGDIDTLDVAGVYLSTGDYVKIANGGESTGAAPLIVVMDVAR